MVQLAETHSALLDAIARQLSAVRDVRARHWLIFPRKGLREAALHRWARFAGIASHSQEVEARELVEQASGGGSARFDVERLRWAVGSALPDLRQDPLFPLPPEASLNPMDATVLASATQWARVIHETLLCRIGGKVWPQGSFLEALTAAPQVARMLRTHPGLQTDADFTTSARAWMESWDSKGGIPHLWILLDAGLPAGLFHRLLQLVDLLRGHSPDRVHLFAMVPSRDYWADLAVKSGSRRRSAGSDPSIPEAGGLLWALGRSSQDLQRQLAGTLLAVGEGGIELDSPEPHDSLLGRLQTSCRSAAPLPEESRRPVSAADASLTIHAAHTPLRELEICRDRVLQALHELEDLRHEEILILLANPHEQAPLIEAALDAGADRRLPFRWAGGGGGGLSPFASTVIRLLEILQGRLTLNEVQELLENPLIADRFDLDETDGDGPTLVQWLQDAGFRWGLGPEHRRQYQDIPESRWNLFWALRRLGLGAMVAENRRDSLLDDCEGGQPGVPLERTNGLGLIQLARLARFAHRLRDARDIWCGTGPRSIPDWNRALRDLVYDCISNRLGPVASQAAALQSEILEPLDRAAIPELRLERTAYLRLLTEKLGSLNGSGGRGPGGITVADLRQYAGVPARVVVVAGLDDGVFPRSDDRPGWHPLALQPATGDPSARDTDRHCLLLALLACRERLILSYQGHSDEDGEERPPSTALADLLEAALQTLPQKGAVSGDPSKPVADGVDPRFGGRVFHHPLHGFSPEAFRADLPASARGQRTADHGAAVALRRRRGFPAYPGPWSQPLPPEPDRAPDLADLRNVLDQPQRLFASRLGLRLPEEAEAPQGEDLVDPDGLERWALRDRLLTARVEGEDEGALVSVLKASGRIPRGRLGEALLSKILEELPELPVFGPKDRVTANLRFTLEEARVGTDPHATGGPRLLRFEGPPRARWYRRPGESTVFQFFASKPNEGGDYRRQLLFGFDALALAASSSTPDPGLRRGDPPLEARCLGPRSIWIMALPTPEMARAQLARLLPLARWARCRALPYWPRTAGVALAKAGRGSEVRGESRLASLAARDPAEILEAALSHWSADREEHSGGADGDLPTTRAVFRGCDDPFAIDGDSVPGWLPCPGGPLAWRLMLEFESWRESLNLRSP
ncbi:MAG: RecBCD enzyme subunit RecC [Verrucomicrobiota bacterium]